MSTDTPERRINPGSRARDRNSKPLPHERDESADRHGDAPRGVMQQAADDLAQGLVDTDLHGARGIEQAVTPEGDGHARPRGDAANGMRHHNANRSSKP